MNDIQGSSNSLCPFCGGTVDPKGWMGTDSRGNRIQGPECEGCGATAPSLEVWNKRHAHEPPAEPDQPAVIQLVAVKNGRACVIGIPAHYSKLPEDHPWQHNCDANGCTSVEHMLWRGPVQDESTAQPPSSDAARLDWLTEQQVDTIYLDDGRIIDVGGHRRTPHDIRSVIDEARSALTKEVKP